MLVEHALDPAWQPAILFAAGSRVAGFADRLVERLLSRPGLSRVTRWFGGADGTRARELFAVRCGAAAEQLSPTNRTRLEQVLESNQRPLSLGESDAYASLGDFVVPFLTNRPELLARTGGPGGAASGAAGTSPSEARTEAWACRRVSPPLPMRQVIGDQAGETATWRGLATIDLEEGNYAAARERSARRSPWCKPSATGEARAPC